MKWGTVPHFISVYTICKGKNIFRQKNTIFFENYNLPPADIQRTIKSLLYQTRRNNPLVNKGLNKSLISFGSIHVPILAHQIPYQPVEIDVTMSILSKFRIFWKPFLCSSNIKCGTCGEQEKESIIRVRVGWKNWSLTITICHHSASLVRPIGDPWDGFFYPTLTLMKNYYITIFNPK